MDKKKIAMLISGAALIMIGLGFFVLTGVSILTIAHIAVGDILLVWGFFIKEDQVDILERRKKR